MSCCEWHSHSPFCLLHRNTACLPTANCLTQGLSPWWGLSHFVLLLLCGLVGLTGMVVALVRFGNTITGLVMSTHQVLGLLSVGTGGMLSTRGHLDSTADQAFTSAERCWQM